MKKNIYCLLIMGYFNLISPFCNAQSEGPNKADTIYDTPAIGLVAWINPLNAIDSDRIYATDYLTTTVSTSHYLEATGFNFTIPSNTTISGITVHVFGHDSVAGSLAMLNYIYLVKNNVIQHDSILVTGISDTDTWNTFGGCSNTWSDTTWNYTDINSPDFGVAYYEKAIFISFPSSMKVFVDEIRTSVCYTIPTSAETFTQTSYAGNIFPNPSHGELELNYKGNYLFQVYEFTGKEIYHSNLQGPQYIDLSFLSGGVYVIHITSGLNSEIRKLVIEK
jgi:hypothetical protein